MELKGKKIGEDKYSEWWSLDGHTYVEVPKSVLGQEREIVFKEYYDSHRSRMHYMCVDISARPSSFLPITTMTHNKSENTPDTEEIVCTECKKHEMVREGSTHQIKATNCRIKPSDPVFFDSSTPDAEGWKESLDYKQAIYAANKFLDEPNIDPDGDECTVSRQFLRMIERYSSRDTYWKERVEEIYSHFSWCKECAEGATCKDALAIKDNLK